LVNVVNKEPVTFLTPCASQGNTEVRPVQFQLIYCSDPFIAITITRRRQREDVPLRKEEKGDGRNKKRYQLSGHVAGVLLSRPCSRTVNINVHCPSQEREMRGLKVKSKGAISKLEKKQTTPPHDVPGPVEMPYHEQKSVMYVCTIVWIWI